MSGRGRQDGPAGRRLLAETERLRYEAESTAAAVLDSQRRRPHGDAAVVKPWQKWYRDELDDILEGDLVLI